MRGWLRGLLLHLTRSRARTRTLVTCQHLQWSACYYSIRWCLNCGYKRKCY